MGYRGRIRNYGFHFEAFPETFRTAKYLRKNITLAEKILWNKIRNRKIEGYKFRRQHPVGQFIVDFFCAEVNLVIEVDGPIHLGNDCHEKDLNRTAELERLEIKVIRFSNDLVFNDIDFVLEIIRQELTDNPPPLQHGEGVGG